MTPLVIMARRHPGESWSGYDGLIDGDLLVEATENVFLDGARALLAEGYPPHQLVTMRWQGKAYESFKPVEILTAARLGVGTNQEGRFVFRRRAPGIVWGHPPMVTVEIAL